MFAASICRHTWAVCVLAGIIFLMCKRVQSRLHPLSLWLRLRQKATLETSIPCCPVTSVCPLLCGEGTGRADTDDHTTRACQLDTVTNLAGITWGIFRIFWTAPDTTDTTISLSIHKSNSLSVCLRPLVPVVNLNSKSQAGGNAVLQGGSISEARGYKQTTPRSRISYRLFKDAWKLQTSFYGCSLCYKMLKTLRSGSHALFQASNQKPIEKNHRLRDEGIGLQKRSLIPAFWDSFLQ